MTLLRWIGRQKTRAIAAVVLIALLTPAVGNALRPFVTEAVIGLLIIAFLRMDVSAIRTYIKRPYIVIATTLWTTLIVPALFILGSAFFGLDLWLPDLFTGIMLQAIASPMMAAPAIAAILGLDATLILITLVCSSALVPFSASAFAALLSLDLPISPAGLGLKLLLILSGSAITGLLLRRLVGNQKIVGHKDEIDGLNILILFVFASAVMADMGGEFLKHPLFVAALIALAFGVAALLLGVTWLVFLAFGAERALAIAIMTSQRNMGLMLAGAGGMVPELTWLYFAAAQFPIHLMPWMVQPIARYLGKPRLRKN